MLLVFTGCASYDAASLSTLSMEAVQVSNSPGILIAAKAFTKTDCKRYLDRDVIKEGYQPVQLYIQNESNKSYIFSMNRISLACAQPEEVANKVHTSTVGRAVGYGAAALIFWPFAIPAIIDGVKSANANESLDNDFSLKSARDQIIFPHSHINTLIFVPVSEYQSAFSVTLLEEKSKQPETLKITTR